MTFTTVPAAGAKLRAATLSALITELRPVYAVKSATTSRNTTTTVTADPHLSIALPADSQWDIQADLWVSSAANAAGDFRYGWTFPTGASLDMGSHGLIDTIASGSVGDIDTEVRVSADTSSPSAETSNMASTTATLITPRGRITVGSTAGNLVLTWAQLASNGNNTNLLIGSKLVARRLS